MPSITIKATDGAGSFAAYVAEPKKKPAGAVVVIQEIFGVNRSLRDICDGFADMGFLAVAPDLFWRQEPGVDITDKSDAEWAKAFALMKGFNQNRGVEDLKATVTAARALPGSTGKVGTVGYCLGGRLAVMMAERSDADVNVSYYGVALDELLGDIGKVKARLLIHIAEKDEFSSPEVLNKVTGGVKGHPHVSAHVYPAVQHAFARVGGVHWDGRAAAIANGRTAEALAAALG